MRRHKNKQRALSALLVVSVVLVSINLLSATAFAAAMKLNSSYETLYLNEDNMTSTPAEFDFNVENRPAGYDATYKFSWKILDEDIATVSSAGVVTAEKVGITTLKCIIKLKATGREYDTLEAVVKVNANAKTVAITNAPENNAIEIGSSFDFNNTMAAANGGAATDKVLWKLAGPECVATINADSGLVTALKPGVFTVQAVTYQSQRYIDTPTAVSEVLTITVPFHPDSYFEVNSQKTSVNVTDYHIITDIKAANDFSVIATPLNGHLLSSTPSVADAACPYYGTGSTVTVQSPDGADVVTCTVIVKSDVNGDSVCDALDCHAVELALTGNLSLENVYFTAADDDGNDIINESDYQAAVNDALNS